MIIVLRSGATDGEVEDVCHRIVAMGYTPHTSRGALRTVIGAVGDDRGKDALRSLESLECVESVTPILKPFKLASREVRDEPTEIRVGDVTIGGKSLVVMAGPCSVESRPQLLEAAEKVKAAGAHILRGGAFKPRTSPYAFQGLEDEGLKLLAEARRETGLPIVTEVMEPDKVDLVAEHADILQVGARNVQNFSLLKRAGARQPERHSLRARHPDFRGLHALHPRPERGARRQEALALARRRRPEPRDGPLGVRRVDGDGRRGGRRRRAHHRGSPATRGGALRRPPVAQARAFRRADGARAPHRAGHGPGPLAVPG